MVRDGWNCDVSRGSRRRESEARGRDIAKSVEVNGCYGVVESSVGG